MTSEHKSLAARRKDDECYEQRSRERERESLRSLKHDRFPDRVESKFQRSVDHILGKLAAVISTSDMFLHLWEI